MDSLNAIVMSEGMEPDVKKYLLKVLNSLSFGALWLIINIWLGIYLGFGITNGRFNFSNILYYAWFALSLCLLIWYYYSKWKK